MVAEDDISDACTHLLESLVVDKASCILGYVELTLLDVLAELPTMEEISVSPPELAGRSGRGVHVRQLVESVPSEYWTRWELISACPQLRRLVVMGSASGRSALRKRHG